MPSLKQIQPKQVCLDKKGHAYLELRSFLCAGMYHNFGQIPLINVEQKTAFAADYILL